MTGTPDAPAKVGISIADISAGLYAYSSILTALIQREQHRRGRAHRHLDAGVSHRMDVAAAVRLAGNGSGAGAGRRAAQHDRPVWRVRCARRRGDVRHSERPRVAPLLRARDAARRRWRTTRVSRTNALRLANRDALEALIEARFRDSHDDGGARAGSRRPTFPTGSGERRRRRWPRIRSSPRAERWTTVDSPGRRDSGTASAAQPARRRRRAWAPVPALGQHTAEVLTRARRRAARPCT